MPAGGEVVDLPDELKRELAADLNSREKELEGWAKAFLAIPEMGFKEEKTSAAVVDLIRTHCPQAAVKTGIGITGVMATAALDNPAGIHVALICELDALQLPQHIDADSNTGAAHACGHHMQMTAAIGAFAALCRVRHPMWGRLSLMAIPAEEAVELEYRSHLVDKGRIRYRSGKQEWVRLGMFDDIDAALMLHAHSESETGNIYVMGGSLGFLAKRIEFIGRESHAGHSPEAGINALNAAMAAIMCIHANRETFRDEDAVRVHPILTKGGDMVNIVPAQVVMETLVRGARQEAIRDAAVKVDRSIQGACIAVGANARIENMPGYLPLFQDEFLSRLFEDNASGLPETATIYRGIGMTGSSDIGDISHLLPTIHPTIGGFAGNPHSVEFQIKDPKTYLYAAKLLAQTAADLLGGEGRRGRELKTGFHPRLTKKQYIDLLESMTGVTRF